MVTEHLVVLITCKGGDIVVFAVHLVEEHLDVSKESREMAL